MTRIICGMVNGKRPGEIIVSGVQTTNSRAKVMSDGDGDDCDTQVCQPKSVTKEIRYRYPLERK